MASDKDLIECAVQASKRAYAPYSRFHVGAALEVESGEVISGCNVENASFGLTNCAERTAIFSAVAQGYRTFRRMALFVDHNDFFFPCGACRQVLLEMAPDMEILVVKGDRSVARVVVRDMLPSPFSPKQLSGR